MKRRMFPCCYRKQQVARPIGSRPFRGLVPLVLCGSLLGTASLRAGKKLDLSTCLHRAAEQNSSVLSARERIEEARAQVGAARAERVPDLDVQDQHMRTNRNFITFLPFPKYTHQVASSLRQRVFSGGQIGAGIRMSREALSAAEAGYRSTLESVLERVANSFLDTLEQSETQSTLEESIATQRRRLEEINAKIDAGVMLETNRLQAELLILEDERALLVSRTREQLARDTLRVLLSLPAGEPLALTEDLGEFTDLDVDALMTDLSLEASPVLQGLQAQIRHGEAMVQSARGAFKPKVDVQVTQYHIANGLTFASQDANYAEAMGVVDIPVFDGGKRRGELRKAERNLEATRHEEQAQEEELTIQVGQAVLGIKEGRARLRASKGRIELAVRNRQIVQDRYLEGAAIQSEILDADLEWHKARLEEITSRFAIFRNTVLLLRLTGRLGRLSLLGPHAVGAPEEASEEEGPPPQEARG